MDAEGSLHQKPRECDVMDVEESLHQKPRENDAMDVEESLTRASLKILRLSTWFKNTKLNRMKNGTRCLLQVGVRDWESLGTSPKFDVNEFLRSSPNPVVASVSGNSEIFRRAAVRREYPVMKSQSWNFGDDLHDQSFRERVLATVQRIQSRLLVLAFLSRVWSHILN